MDACIHVGISFYVPFTRQHASLLTLLESYASIRYMHNTTTYTAPTPLDTHGITTPPHDYMAHIT